MVTVCVPDGVYEGQEFQLEFEGQVLNVICPDGCAGGDEINLEVPAAPADGAPPPPMLVDVVIPDGCYAGNEFTVDFDGKSFNIIVPDGLNPGEMLTVESVKELRNGARQNAFDLATSSAKQQRFQMAWMDPP